MAAERMRKAKILFRDILDSVIDPDPAGGLPGSAASQIAAASKGNLFFSVLFQRQYFACNANGNARYLHAEQQTLSVVEIQ